MFFKRLEGVHTGLWYLLLVTYGLNYYKFTTRKETETLTDNNASNGLRTSDLYVQDLISGSVLYLI
jgi:hypothetical protein